MPEPKVANGGSDPDEPASSDADDDEEEDVGMVETSVEESGADPGGFFDDVDTAPGSDDGDAEGIFDGVDDGGDSGSSGGSAGPTPELEDDINRGAARLSVIGLDDSWETEDGDTRKKQDLQDEFEETFAAFRLGHYGSVCVEEYLLVEAEEIHPAWGLCGAMLICAAVVVYRRPDGDQIIEDGKTKLGNVNLGSFSGEEEDES